MKKILFLTLLMASASVMAQNNQYQYQNDPVIQNDPFKYDPSYVPNPKANGGSLTETIQTKTIYPDGTEVKRQKSITEYSHDGTEGR
jgi:uncharacterized GH25 family protein